MRILLPLAALGLLFAGPVRAEMVPFSYAWTVLPVPDVLGQDVAGAVTLTTAPPGSDQTLAGGFKDIPGATATVALRADATGDTFNAPFSLQLRLTDTASGQQHDFLFAGNVHGSVTPGSSSLFAEFQQPTTQAFDMGGHAYSVTIAPTTVTLPAPGSNAEATIGARVAVGAPLVDTPEPATMVLGGLGLASFAVHRFVRRRNPA